MNEDHARSRPRRHRFALVLLLALALVAASCGSSDDNGDGETATPGNETGRELVEEGTPQPGGKLVIAIPGETDGWHPTANNWATEGHFAASAVIETLGIFDANGDVIPYLAETIEPNEDFTTWTVMVKEGITFHDGSPLNADAVKQNLDTAFFSGLTSLTFEDTIDQAVVVDDRTVEIRLLKSLPNFENVLAGVPGYIVAPAMLDDPDASLNPIGTGPFEFDEWQRDNYFRATKYDDYWQTDADGNPLPYLDEIEYRVIVDDEQRANALETGDVDMIVTTNGEVIDETRDNPDTVLIEDNFSEETFILLNTSAPPFDNEHARAALAYGTDREAAVNATEAGIAVVAESPWAPGTPWAPEDAGWVEYDPARAEEEVRLYQEETGQPLRFAFSGIAGNPDSLELQQFLADQWSQIGIETSIDTTEQTTYIGQIVGGNYEAAWFRNFSFTDPDSLYVFFHSTYANGVGDLSINFSQVTSEELDAALDEGRASGDDEERVGIYEEVAQLLNAEQAHIWLFHTPFAIIARPEVQGLNPAREQGFGNLQPKPWIGGLWLESS